MIKLDSRSTSSQPCSLEEIMKKQLLSDRQEKSLKQYWHMNFKKLETKLYMDEKKINIETYQDEIAEEHDIVVIPKNQKKINVKVIVDSPNKSFVPIVVEEQNDTHNPLNEQFNLQQDPLRINKPLETMCDGLMPLENNDDSSDRMIQESFQEIKNDEEKNDEQPSQETVLNMSFVQKQIKQRLQQIKDKQTITPEDKYTCNEESMSSPIIGGSIGEEAIMIDENMTERKQKQNIMDCEEKHLNGQVQNEKSNKEQEEADLEEKVWFPLQNPGQVPLAFLSDWKFKGSDKINIDFGRKYTVHQLFHLMFTEEMYSHIIQSIFEKQRKRLLKKGILIDEEFTNITSYELDALISLILHYKCLNIPNQLSKYFIDN